MRKLACLTILWLTLIWTVLYGSPLSLFWDLSSFLFVFGLMFIFIFARFKTSELSTFRNQAASCFLELGLASSVISILGAIILVLLQLKQPQKIGPPIAFGILSSLYILVNSLSALVLEKKNSLSENTTSSRWQFSGVMTLVVAVVISGILIWAGSLLVDPISLLFMFGIVLAVISSRHDIKSIIDRNPQVGVSLISATLLGGAAGCLIGLVQILQNMSDMSLVWAGVGSSLLTYLYGVIFAFLGYAFFPHSRVDTKAALLSFLSVFGGIVFFVLIDYAI